MILLVAVVTGLLAGLLRARWAGRPVLVPRMRLGWLLGAAFVPQFLVFYLPFTRQRVPDQLAPPVLIGTTFLLLLFTLANRDKPGFGLLTTGLALNLLVMASNGGLMPISPESLARVAPSVTLGAGQAGWRLGIGKDVVEPVDSTRLWALSDRLLFPSGFPVQSAFSPGDVLIAAGAFRLLWTIGRGVPGDGSA